MYDVAMGLQRFPLGGFLGGMNLVDSPYALKSGEAQIARDVDLGFRDVLSSRRGFTSSGLAGVVGSVTKSPGTVTTGGGAGVAWGTPENAKASDNTYAKAAFEAFGFQTEVIKATNFGIVLPAGAVPIGIKLRVERKAEVFGKPGVKDKLVQLLIAGVLSGNNNLSASQWPTVDTYQTYGGEAYLWGLKPTKAQVENVNFGAGLSAEWILSEEETSVNWLIDHMEITVYYLVEGGAGADHARPWYSGAKRLLILSQNGKITSLNGSESKITELFSGTAGTTWCYEQMEYNPGAGYKDSVWCMNGTDAAKKWDGTTFSNWAGKPPKGTMLRVWKNRMIVAGVAAFPQRLFYSDIANPESPEDETNGGYGNNWIDIRTSEDDLDPITWIEVIDDVLLVFKKKSVNAIYDGISFSFQRIANVGCENRFQSCVVDDRAYFVNRSGVYSVTAQGEPRYESLNIEPLFKGTGPSELEAIDLNLLMSSAKMCSLSNGRIYLSVTPPGELANLWLLEGYPRLRNLSDRDDKRTPWVKHEFAERCIKCLAPYRTKDSEVDKLIAGLTKSSGLSPELVQLFEGTRDGIEDITWRWKSGYKSLISEEPKERVRRVNLLMKGKCNATLDVDGDDKETVTLETAIAGTEVELKRYRPEGWGRYHALNLNGVGPIRTEIFKGELVLRGGKEH